jgi:hypothetical protein
MKRITWETNWNNKLDSDCFMHLDLAPTLPVAISLMPMDITIATKDNSHEPVVTQLYSIIGGMLKDFYADFYTHLSHGLDKDAFINWWLEAHPGFDDSKTELAMYCYKKSRV